ncbi:MAG: hypothetical protein U0W24_03855 [Bacteroidales bacterium]
MHSRLSFILFLVFFVNQINSQTDTSKVKWLDFNETKLLFEKTQKPVLIFFHDSKSDSSELMLNKTFGLNEVANYINILFYPIKFEIHSKNEINFFDGRVYKPSDKKDGIHSMVDSLLGKGVKMPAMILFTKKAVGTVYQGYKSRDNIFPILIYYAESLENSVSFEKFEEYYFKTYPPGQNQVVTRVLVKWKSIEEAFENSKILKKKILVNLYDNYSTSSTMLSLKTFNNPIIADYLNKNFICVNLNARTKDTILFFSQKYINEGAPHGFHQLPIVMLSGKMQFPAFLIFDEDQKLLDRFQTYMTPEDFEVLIHFIGDNDYKTKKWEDYKNSFKSSFTEENQIKKN